MSFWDTTAGKVVETVGRGVAAYYTYGASEIAIKGYEAMNKKEDEVPVLDAVPDMKAAQKALAAEQDKVRRNRARASTVLTSSSGVSGSARTVSRTLMGA